MGYDEYEYEYEYDEYEYDEVQEDLTFAITDEFFIRRNGKVKGPMDAERIRKLVKSKKLKPSDEVSLSVDGSWDRLSNAYKDIMSGTYVGTYVDSAATTLPPRKSNRKKKVDKPLDGVERLGSEGQIARMAMYKKYRTTLYITAGVVLFIIVVGVPSMWIAGTNFWGVVYENTPAAANVEAGSTPSKSNDPVKRFEETIMTQILERSVPQTYVDQQFELGDRSKPFWVKRRLSWNPTYNIEKTNSLTTPLQATVYINAKEERVNPPAGDLYGHRTKSGVIASQDWRTTSVDIESKKPFFFGYQDGEWRFTPTERQALYYGTKGAPWPITSEPTYESTNDDLERID